MAYNKVAVIGAGIIGEALIGTLLESGFKKDSIFTLEKRPERLVEVLDRYGIQQPKLNVSNNETHNPLTRSLS